MKGNQKKRERVYKLPFVFFNLNSNKKDQKKRPKAFGEIGTVRYMGKKEINLMTFNGKFWNAKGGVWVVMRDFGSKDTFLSV